MQVMGFLPLDRLNQFILKSGMELIMLGQRLSNLSPSEDEKGNFQKYWPPNESSSKKTSSQSGLNGHGRQPSRNMDYREQRYHSGMEDPNHYGERDSYYRQQRYQSDPGNRDSYHRQQPGREDLNQHTEHDKGTSYRQQSGGKKLHGEQSDSSSDYGSFKEDRHPRNIDENSTAHVELNFEARGTKIGKEKTGYREKKSRKSNMR